MPSRRPRSAVGLKVAASRSVSHHRDPDATFRRVGVYNCTVRVLEEPFLTRDVILRVYRPAEITAGRPFRLGAQRAASRGQSVAVRTSLGQFVGRVHVYSALNADAARAYRLGDKAAARELANRATELEASPAAATILSAIRSIASNMPGDPLSNDAPARLRRYLEQRRVSSSRGLDPLALAREWLVQSAAWLTAESDQLTDAVSHLGRRADEARAQILEGPLTASTFYGVVQRMDPSAAEIEGPGGETMLIPRIDLDREGLAAIGQAVSLLQEALPGGGSFWLPMPAVAIDADVGERPPESPLEAGSPLMDFFRTPGGALVTDAPPADRRWFERELAREPTAVPAAPLPVR